LNFEEKFSIIHNKLNINKLKEGNQETGKEGIRMAGNQD